MLAKEPAGDDLLEAMLAQSSPFAATLSSALQEAPPRTSVFEPGWERLAGEAQPSAAPSAGPPVAADEPWAPVPDDRAAAAVLERIPTQVARSRQAVRSTVLEVVDELAGLRAELVSASVPLDLAGEIIAEARDGLRSFDPDTPMRELVRRSLTSRIPLAQVRVTGQRRIAVVGTAGSGRTLAAASLMCAYAQAGHSVGALSLEPGRKAVRLADLLGGLDAPFEIAQTPAAVTRATTALGATDVVIADVPALRDGVDPRCLSKALALLKAFRPDETHVVMPAGTGAEEGRALVDALTATGLPLRLIVSHTDDQAPSGVAVGVALTHRIPVSFVGCGPSIGRLRPPEPHVLASMVIA
jgi:signal recognition particle GTPase